jgi:hypothetical protein
MNRICYTLSAVVIASAMQLSSTAAQTPASNELYYAPSWWIAAFTQGDLGTLRTGNANLDRRMSMWVIGFGNGLGATCGQPERSAQPNPIYRQGVADGQRFAQVNGCSSTPAQAALQTAANPATYATVAVVQQANAEHAGTQQQDGRVAREATIVNRSGTRIDVVQMSETTDDGWGVDRLGNDRYLNSRGRVRLELSNARSCNFDVRVTYADRRVEERRNVNLCTNPQVEFDRSQARAASR